MRETAKPGHWFTQTGPVQGDFCLYATRLPVRDVPQDVKAFGIDMQQKAPLWIAGEGLDAVGPKVTDAERALLGRWKKERGQG
ncbi:MAG TPA: hypothetical protein VJR06_06655 [Nitrososphaerales archaeon]|nr:hypothetical protein [Nitrososphaerales archaeon]